MNVRPLVLAAAFVVPTLVGLSAANANILFLNHFDSSLDADHSQYREPQAMAGGLQLSKDGDGYLFEGSPPRRALDAGYSDGADRQAVVRFSQANLASTRGTIEVWVKTAWDADPPQTLKQNRFRHFFSAPLENKGSINLYYACYHGNSYTPYIAFHINDGRSIIEGQLGPDYIVNFRLAPDETGNGFVWKKDTWHYLVATWTPTKLRLFCDGKLMAEQPFDKPIDIPPGAGPICVGNNTGNWGGTDCLAEALIDEVRISDGPLYEDMKEIPVPKTMLDSTTDAAIIAAGGPTVLRQPDPRQYECYFTDTPPVIDGQLDDPAWQRLPAMSGFLIFGKVDEFTPVQTEARFCRDDKNIYVAVLAYENQPEKLKSNVPPDPTGKENGAVFADDSVEVFFGTKRGELPNVQIGINSLNARCDILHKEGSSDLKWNGTYQTATAKRTNAWIVELAFPCENLGPPPKLGDIWGMRVARNRNVGGLFLSAVNYASTGYQNPIQFARLVMAGELPKLDVTKQENLLNQDYIKSTRATLEKFLREAKPQMAFSADVPAAVKQQAGITPLEDAIQSSLADYQSLLNAKKPSPIRTWNEARLRAETDNATLEKLGYLLANAGGLRATLPSNSLTGIGKENGLWYLASDQMAAAIEPKHGMVAGIWDRVTGQPLVVNGYFLYQAQTRTNDVSADERTDKVTRLKHEGDRLVVDCTNPSLPGVKLRKSYYLETIGKSSRLLCRRIEITGKVPEPTLLQVTSRTLYDENYRKPSWYNRIFVIGTMGDGRSSALASEVTSRVQQRAWFNSEEGRAQFALANPATDTGLGEYLYKENDAWAFPQALPSSYWTPFGWDMGFCQLFVDDPAYRKKPYSAELRYHLFRGDRWTFHREYMSLPEYAALLADPPLPRAAHIIDSVGASVGQLWPDEPRIAKLREGYAGTAMQALYRPDEFTCSAYAATDKRWPDYPAADDQEWVVPHHNNPTVIVERGKCADMKGGVAAFRALNPRFLSQTYDFVTDIYKLSETYKLHPDWVRTSRDGQPVVGFYGGSYWSADWSKGYVDALIAGLLRSIDYYKFDVCYLDFSVGIVVTDWKRSHVVTLAEQIEFVRRLREELHTRGVMLWLNSFQGQPYYDIGFFEGLGGSYGRHWRDHAEAHLTTKLYAPPGVPIIPLYWHGGDQFKESGESAGETVYLDKTVGAGLTSHACYLDPYHLHFPALDGSGGADWVAVAKYQMAVHHAALELRPSEWADAGLRDPWWENPQSTLEAYTLRMPDNTHLVNVISHQAKPADATVSVDLNKMGFDPGKRTFVWQLLRRDYASYPKQNPVPSNWNELFSTRVCASSVPGKSELSYVIPQLPPDRLCATAITQTPAAIISAAGIPTQTLLPAVLNCGVTGSADESAKRVTLTVNCNKPVEIIAWWPKTWGAAHAKVATTELPTTPISFGSEDFVRFVLEKGQWNVELSTQ